MTISRQHWRMARRGMETRVVRKMTKGSGIARMTAAMSGNLHGLVLEPGLPGENGSASGAVTGIDEIMGGRGR